MPRDRHRPLPAGSARSARSGPRLSQDLLQRFIGVIYRPDSERYSHYMQADPGRQYDAWVWFDETTALVAAEDAGNDGALPDTWPFGL
ncbi:erythromycin esterase family protein [Paracoccus aerius]